MVSTAAGAQRGRSPRQAPVRINSGTTPTTPASPLTITIAPNATVWIDDIRRGVTDASGELVLTKISPGRHMLRVRANGFKEVTMPLVPGRGTLVVKLVQTTDQAELLFQKAETGREQAKDDDAREKAAD